MNLRADTSASRRQTILTGRRKQLGHDYLVGNGAARSAGRFPRLVLRDGGVDLRLLDLLGRGVLPERCEHAVLTQRNNHGGLAAQMNHLVIIALLC